MHTDFSADFPNTVNVNCMVFDIGKYMKGRNQKTCVVKVRTTVHFEGPFCAHKPDVYCTKIAHLLNRTLTGKKNNSHEYGT